MAKAVIGIFDSAAEAQQAVRNLESRGITRDHVEITERSGIETEREEKSEGIGESISNFFSNLFGNDDDAKNYSEVANRGCTVTVYTDSLAEAENAADILDDCGAIDVKERANQYRSGINSDINNPQRSSADTSGRMETNRMPGDLNTGVPGSTAGNISGESTDWNTRTGQTGSGDTDWSSRTGERSQTTGETGWSSPSGEMRSSEDRGWSNPSGENPNASSGISRENESQSGLRRSRILDTPEDFHSRIGRRHPSPSDRNTTGDINPLNQSPDTPGI
ncbi:MAG TPA: hypothetical protein VGD90_12210 [Sphingobacteriaceae bacterium]